LVILHTQHAGAGMAVIFIRCLINLKRRGMGRTRGTPASEN